MYQSKIWRTSSTAVALSIGFIGTGLLNAHAAVQTIKAEQASATLNMPAVDSRLGAPDSVGEAVIQAPRQSSVSDEELTRLKNMGGSANGPVSTDEAQSPDPAPKAVLIGCTMNTASGSAPSDVHGAVTPTNIIEVTNSNIMVRNKGNCALVSSMTLKTFFSQNFGFVIPAAESLFDPRVVYDRLAGRCIVTVESRNSGNTDQFLYVASSRTSSCTTWRRIRFVISRVSPAGLFCKTTASHFYDYPNLGYNNTRAVVSANVFTAAVGGSFAYTSVISIDKVALHGIATVFARCFLSPTYPFTLAPAIVGDTSLSMILASTGAGSGNTIRRYRLTPSGSGSGIADTLTALTNVVIPAWTAPPDAVQPNLQKIDSLDGRFQGASKQIGSVMWNVHAVNVSGFSRWRLYKFSISSAVTSLLFTRTPTTSTCAFVDHLFNPSIDTNSSVTTALAFVTASRTCPSQAVAGRAAHLIFRGQNSFNTGWVFNTVATSVNNFAILGGAAGSAACNTTGVGFRGSCRWGDYSSTQIDPSSTATAWGFNQLITTGSLGGVQSQFNWTTRGGRVN